MKLREAAKDYLEYCKKGARLSDATIKAYGGDMERFLSFCEGEGRGETEIDLQSVGREAIQAYFYKENSCRKAKTVKRRVASLRGFYGYLENRDLIETNPMDRMRFKIKDAVRLPDCLSLQEMERLLETVHQQVPTCGSCVSEKTALFLRDRDAAILELLFATGLRVHELCGLTRGTFDLKAKTIRVVGKGQKERLLYVGNDEVMGAVRRYLAAAESLSLKSEFIFLNRNGGRLSSQSVRMLVRGYAEKAGIGRRITPHTLRHTFASLLLEEGVDIKYIQEFLGHSSISTTQIYLHTSEAKKRQILTDLHPRTRLRITNP